MIFVKGGSYMMGDPRQPFVDALGIRPGIFIFLMKIMFRFIKSPWIAII